MHSLAAVNIAPCCLCAVNFTLFHVCLLLCFVFPQCFAVLRRAFCNFLCVSSNFSFDLMSNFKKIKDIFTTSRSSSESLVKVCMNLSLA